MLESSSEKPVETSDKSLKIERLNNLKTKYNKLLEWAKDQEFTTVYRGEGSHGIASPMDQIVSEDQGLTGSWYAESIDKARGYLSSQEGRLYSLIIAKSTLAQREEDYEKAAGEINIINQELQPYEIKKQEDAPVPNLDNFMDQFTFIKEYKELKRELED